MNVFTFYYSNIEIIGDILSKKQFTSDQKIIKIEKVSKTKKYIISDGELISGIKMSTNLFLLEGKTSSNIKHQIYYYTIMFIMRNFNY